MPVSSLEQVLADARAQEAKTQELNRKLKRMLAELHPSIQLPEAARLATLQAFVEEYVAHVPRLVRALEEAAFEARQDGLITPLLTHIKAAFTLKEGEGLATLLDRAYYVQRLVEEVNDRFHLLAGAPLLTLDMTTANLIIHSLIGEPYANQLDEEAGHTAAHIIDMHVGNRHERFYAENESQRFKMWTAAWRHWSEEFRVEGIEVKFLS